MTIFYKDITKKGKTVYYKWVYGRFYRVSAAEVEIMIATENAVINDYFPNKPYEEMTKRQLNAALTAAYGNGNTDSVKLISAVLCK